MKRIILLVILLVILTTVGVSAGLLKFDAENLPKFFQTVKKENIIPSEKVRITNE